MRCVSPARLRGGQPARPRLGGRDRADRRRAARRAHRARGAVRAAAPGQRPRLARPGAPGRAVPRRLAGARAPRLAAVAPGLTRAHRLCVGVALGLLLLVGPVRPERRPARPRPTRLGARAPPAARARAGGGHRGAVDGVPPRRRSRCSSACAAGWRRCATWLAPGILALARPAGGAVRLGRPRQLPRLRPHPGHGRQPVGRRADQLGRRPRPRHQPGRGAVDHRAERLRALRHAAARAARPGSGAARCAQGVWVWQLLVVLSWLAVRALLRAVLDPDLHGRVDVLWTLNPLVVGIGVLGAHIDVVATALALAAVVVAARLPGWTGAALSGVFVALAGSTKFTYAVVAVGVVAAWWVVGHRSAVLARLVGALAAGARRRGRRAAPVGGAARLRPAAPVAPGRVARDPVAAAARVGPRHLGQRADPHADQRRGGGARRAAGVVPPARSAAPPSSQLSRPMRKASPSHRNRTPAKVKVPVRRMPPARRRASPPSRSGSPRAWRWPTRSRRPTRCPGTTCWSGAPCRRCCPAWSTSSPWCAWPRWRSPTCRAGCSA